MFNILLLHAALWLTPVGTSTTPEALFPAAGFPAFAIQTDPDIAAIQQVLNQQVTDWNKGDIVAFMTGYWNSDSVMFMTKKGPQYGYKPVMEHYKQVYPNKAAMGTLDFSHLIYKRLSAEYYFVVGAFHLHLDNRTDVGGNFTLLFRKIDGAWKIVVDHTS
jgi:ketosteroid isomerase-like protein